MLKNLPWCLKNCGRYTTEIRDRKSVLASIYAVSALPRYALSACYASARPTANGNEAEVVAGME
jgi:hypothetical protein